ncbi:hypothetical protein ROZALSC1DRAFT_26825 [Rozella allomycis CSF55]|uniref:SMP-LTD domain-containing protein n=1 Tax=Rozella allomycis (strain CSF55) TaxID=988480 RepID=A0A4P9YR14_ROZAC|nr:hypothetical protein ROZALSC1DRAFT_26825 [Rozella allomycis CSF55]
MSCKLFWDKWKSEKINQSLCQSLNEYFQKLERPDFIGDIKIRAIFLGEESPEIEILDITDPLEEIINAFDANITPSEEEDFEPLQFQVNVSLDYDGNAGVTIETEFPLQLDIMMDSDVGEGQVLKNTGKIEKFIVENINSIPQLPFDSV